jgi:hypothetical protein
MPVLEVDCTQFVIEVLAAANFARICTELPAKAENVLPIVQVVQAGGSNDGVILDRPQFALHGYAETGKAADAVLRQAFTVLRLAVGRVIEVDGQRAVMAGITHHGGPTVAAAENPKLRHRVALVQARIKVA